jgi:hypothetical protein
VVAIGVLVLAAIAFGFWLWSVRSVEDPIDAHPVDAYAVVVSSPSCTAGSGATVVDLNLDTAVRSSLSACGRRVGERVAVQYLAGHPDQARLAGTAVAHNGSAGRWLPIAILAAGLLAVIGTLSLLVERRRSRHDGTSAGATARPTVAQLRAAAAMSDDADATVAGAAHRSTAPRPAESIVVAPGGDAELDAADEAGADTTTRIAAGAMRGIGSTPLRPSDIVDEDLFTHRTHHPVE